MDALLSAKFASAALDDAVVVNTGQDENGGLNSTKFGTRGTVSMGGLWGWLGWREHTSSTLTQQKALFAQLKAELRQKYLGEEGVLGCVISEGKELNDDIWAKRVS